jgi:hypothetical protein
MHGAVQLRYALAEDWLVRVVGALRVPLVEVPNFSRTSVATLVDDSCTKATCVPSSEKATPVEAALPVPVLNAHSTEGFEPQVPPVPVV